MDVKKYFEYKPELELTAAQIGINKWDWICIDEENDKNAIKIMKSHRFDILPLRDNKEIINYFKTRRSGDYNNIDLQKIRSEDKIYYRLSFIDLLRKMRSEKRVFFFLSDAKEILGLVSISNLNSLAVYNYLYQIIASLERLISEYLETLLDEDRVILALKESSDKQALDMVEYYESLQKNNSENSIFQHTYIQTLGTLLKKFESEIPHEHKGILKFQKKFSGENLYNRIRKCVAHPVRPLFVNEQSIEDVYELINDYMDMQNQLAT